MYRDRNVAPRNRVQESRGGKGEVEEAEVPLVRGSLSRHSPVREVNSKEALRGGVGAGKPSSV
jgi:hypothetical protein